MVLAERTSQTLSRAASHHADAAWPPAVCRAAGLAGWTLVIGCLVWRSPFRFVFGTMGASLLLHGAARGDAAGTSRGGRRTFH